VIGGAVHLDGVADHLDFGHARAFRLVGSMTVSAWVNATSFPADDAAIVSSHNGLGYQLDTTVDQGPRTTGFKLADPCGELMARYGATPLVTGVWYYVAGVYDAGAQTLDVYLNGELDNGPLVGAVSATQRSSRERLSVGRRSDLEGYEFAGLIDEVRIYSRALTKPEILADMQGTVMKGSAALRATARAIGSHNERPLNARLPDTRTPNDLNAPCSGSSDSEDAQIPGVAAVLGVLAAIACIGLRPSAGRLTCLVVSLAAGLLLLPAISPTLPLLTRWMLPVVSLAGGASVAMSLVRPSRPAAGG
jgi:hypothetical protein